MHLYGELREEEFHCGCRACNDSRTEVILQQRVSEKAKQCRGRGLLRSPFYWWGLCFQKRHLLLGHTSSCFRSGCFGQMVFWRRKQLSSLKRTKRLLRPQPTFQGLSPIYRGCSSGVSMAVPKRTNASRHCLQYVPALFAKPSKGMLKDQYCFHTQNE